IMPPRMRTQSAIWPVAESRGGGTGERVLGDNKGVEGVNRNAEGVNRGVGGAPDFLMIIAQQLQYLLPAMLAQVGNHGNVGNQNGNVVNENVQENVRNVIVNGNRVGCSYKEFLACNPKKYDGKGGVVVLTRWNEKMESVHDMSGFSIDQKVKYIVGSFVEFYPSHEMKKLESELWNHAIVGAGHAANTDRFHELARLVPHLVTPESRMIERYVYGLAPQIRGMVTATEPKTMQKAVQISGALTDEAVRNGSIKKVEKRVNVGEPSKDRSGRDDNKRTRTENVFATTVNPVGRKNMGIDWLSNYKAEIIRHEKVVRIPLPDGKVSEKKQEEIIMVRDFPKVFLDDLSGLPPIQEIEFWMSQTPGSKRCFIVDPSKIEAVKNWKAPRILTEGKEQESAFQTLKDKLYNVPVLALPDGPEDVVVIVVKLLIDVG
ncbi:hypothetical protein Tco_0323471, partial [Tanacetum coccineum]